MLLTSKRDLSWNVDYLLNGEKNTPDQRVKRFVKVMKSSDVAKRVEVKLHWYTRPAFKALPKIKFTPMKDLINQLHRLHQNLQKYNYYVATD